MTDFLTRLLMRLVEDPGQERIQPRVAPLFAPDQRQPTFADDAPDEMEAEENAPFPVERAPDTPAHYLAPSSMQRPSRQAAAQPPEIDDIALIERMAHPTQPALPDQKAAHEPTSQPNLSSSEPPPPQIAHSQTSAEHREPAPTNAEPQRAAAHAVEPNIRGADTAPKISAEAPEPTLPDIRPTPQIDMMADEQKLLREPPSTEPPTHHRPSAAAEESSEARPLVYSFQYEPTQPLATSARREASEPADMTESEAPAPTIQITIGRIDVKANVQPPPQTALKATAPRLSLDDYLRADKARRAGDL